MVEYFRIKDVQPPGVPATKIPSLHRSDQFVTAMSSEDPDLKGGHQRRKEPEMGEMCPLENAGLLSYCYFSWVSPFLWKAHKISSTSKKAGDKDVKAIDGSSVFANPRDLNPEVLAGEFDLSYAKGGMWAAITDVMRPYTIKATIFQAVASTTTVFIPLVIMQLLKLVEHDSGNLRMVLVYTGLIAASLAFNSVLANMNVFVTFLGANKFQLGLIGAIQRKALRLSAASRQKFGGGVGVNIIGVDPLRMFSVLGYVPYLIGCPYHLILAFSVVSVYVGWSVIAGILAIAMFFPMQYAIVKFTSRFRKVHARFV